VPNYHSAWGGIGRTLAAQGDLTGAIDAFKRAQQIAPMPEYAAALDDLYSLSGNRTEAAKQLATIDAIDKMGQASKEKGNRALALIYSDKNHRLERALELAQGELAIRQDVFTWDALAWALHKNGKHEEAARAIEKALAMNTPEAQFHYHAGMIFAALGKKPESRMHLERALELNPAFDVRQAAIARKKLAEVS
jgi:tetratricopeptide (TPR) repeat protein